MSFRFSDLLLRPAYRRKASVLSVYTTFVNVSPNGWKIGFICEAEQWRKLSTQRLGQFSGPSQCEAPTSEHAELKTILRFCWFFSKIFFQNFFSKYFLKIFWKKLIFESHFSENLIIENWFMSVWIRLTVFWNCIIS